ncbi:hypothetical protein ADL12_19510 [Streptomyces regalis]|uniref:Uncharacterized protein n=1 Tax=Streptomyces regalis TaxID=68262 RepID=A0A0X3UUL8_9ACTN|nr:hypothetical protein ADL12_19510 [Streptomyces regalis]
MVLWRSPRSGSCWLKTGSNIGWRQVGGLAAVPAGQVHSQPAQCPGLPVVRAGFAEDEAVGEVLAGGGAKQLEPLGIAGEDVFVSIF